MPEQKKNKKPKKKAGTEKKEEAKPLGRPSSFTQEIADRICTEIATSSKSLKTICQEEDMPHPATVMRWLDSNKAFRDKYTRAKEEQADFLTEEILEIADDGTNDYMTITKGDQTYNVEDKEVTNRSKLRVEARKWIASKLKPKKYGEKIDHTTDGKPIGGSGLNLSNVPLNTLLELAKHIDHREDKE